MYCGDGYGNDLQTSEGTTPKACFSLGTTSDVNGNLGCLPFMHISHDFLGFTILEISCTNLLELRCPKLLKFRCPNLLCHNSQSPSAPSALRHLVFSCLLIHLECF